MYVCMCVCMRACVCVCEYGECTMKHEWQSEGNLGELVFFFYCIGPGAQIQVIRFGGKCFYLLTHLGGP